jgi:hypothetical protein
VKTPHSQILSPGFDSHGNILLYSFMNIIVIYNETERPLAVADIESEI